MLTMTNTHVTLDHFDSTMAELRALLIGGFETMNARFDRLEQRVDRLEVRMDSLEAVQHETNQRLGRIELAQAETNIRLDLIESTLLSHYADIKELYRLLSDTKKRFGKQLEMSEDLSKRVLRVEKFARAVAARTGMSYKV